MSDTDLAFRATLDGSGFASGMQNLEGSINRLGIQTNSAMTSMGGLGTVIGTLANPMNAFAVGAAAAGAALAGSVQAAASFQTSMAGVAKTTGLGGSDLQGLSQQILDMSTNMPVAASELANIAQVAGSLGVAKEDIAGFSEVAAQMGVAFELPADQAATSAAKILTAFGKDIDASNMTALGNAVNTLGDSTAATEPQILEFVNRASFLSATFGQSIPQVAALGATLISTGMQADVAATGIKSLLNIGLEEKTKGKGLNAISELMGTSNESIKEAFGQDLQGTLSQVADQLLTIEDPVERFNTAVNIAGTEGATALLKLAGQSENLKTNLGAANSEWENGSSMMKTYEANTATLDSQMQIFWNTVNKAGVELGNVMLPTVTDLVKGLGDLVAVATSAGESIYTMLGIDQWDENSKKADQAILGFFGYDLSETGATTAQDFSLGFENGISDSYEDIDGTLTDTLNKAGENSGTEGGETSAEAFAKAQENWIKANGSQFEAGMTAVAYDPKNKATWDGWISQAEAVADEVKDQNLQLEGQDYILRNIVGTQSQYYQLLDASGKKIAETESMLLKVGVPQINPTEWAQGVASSLVVPIKLEFDKESISNNIAPIKNMFGQVLTGDAASMTLKGILESYVIMADEAGRESAQKYAEAFASGMAEPDWENIGAMEDAKNAIAKASPWEADKLEDQYEAYKNALHNQVADADTFVKDEMKNMGKEAKSAFEDGLLSGEEKDKLLGLESELNLLKELFPNQFAEIGDDSIQKMIAAIKAGDLPGAMDAIGATAGDAFKTSYANALKAMHEGANPEDFGIIDLGRYTTLAQKELTDKLGEYVKKGLAVPESGPIYQEFMDVFDVMLRNYDKLDARNKRWVDDIEAIRSGQILKWNEVYDLMGGKMDDLTKKTEKASVGYDNLKKTIEDCKDCAISDFAEWQEAQDNLFQGSYIGEGGNAYKDWAEARNTGLREAQTIAKSMGATVLGKDYTGERGIPTPVDLDTSPAYSQLEQLKSDIQKEIKIPVSIDSKALEQVKNLVSAVDTDKETKNASNDLKNSIDTLNSTIKDPLVPLMADIAELMKKLIEALKKSGQDQQQGMSGKDKEGMMGVRAPTWSEAFPEGIPTMDTADDYMPWWNDPEWIKKSKETINFPDNGPSNFEIERMMWDMIGWPSTSGYGGSPLTSDRLDQAWSDAKDQLSEQQQMTVTADTSGAQSAIQELASEVEKSHKMPIEVDSTAASNSIKELDQSVTKEHKFNLTLDPSKAMAAIAQIDAAASRPVTKIVYIQEVGGSDGGGSGGSSSNNAWGRGASGSNFPPLYAEGGYASRAQLAIVGDSPGGEWMIPNDKMHDLVSSVLEMGRVTSSSANLSMNADLSSASKALSSWTNSIQSTPISLPVEVDILINTSTVREMIQDALNEIVQSIRA